MQIAKTLDRATRVPMAATIATTGRTAARPWNIVGTVTIGCILGKGDEAASKEVRSTPTNRQLPVRVCLRSTRPSLGCAGTNEKAPGERSSRGLLGSSRLGASANLTILALANRHLIMCSMWPRCVAGVILFGQKAAGRQFAL